MSKEKISIEKKRLDVDLWIIVLVTFGVYICYAMTGNQLTAYVKDSEISVVPRLLLNAVVQFGVAGAGITIVCLLRREKFTQFGLRKKNLIKAIFWTIISFIPYICCGCFMGQFDGWKPFSILITKDVLTSGIPFSIIGLAIIILVWGFFEGFNYVVICDKINKRYPSKNQWIDYGAAMCAIVCVLFHPISTTLFGIIEIITTVIAIYGMLIAKKKTDNAWGCVFAFCLIWNAI